LIAWRKSSFESLKKAFFWPTAIGLAITAALALLGIRHPYALVSFLLCAFVLVTVAVEFWKGASAISSKNGSNIFSSMIELTHRNTRRYGGYLVHVGVVLMFIGFTGNAFNKDTTVQLEPGKSVALGSYVLKINGVEAGRNDNYRWGKMEVQVYDNGKDKGVIYPERRFYFASQTQTSEVAIRRRLNEDLYVVYDGNSDAGDAVIMKAYVFPLVSWIWIGYWVVFLGTIVCLIPSKSRLIWPRTEVVGITKARAARGALVKE
jgi:cytochrome c-type biogenesis protein CcmF